MKTFDIVAPKDNWEAGYVKLEFARMGLYTIGDRRIEVIEWQPWFPELEKSKAVIESFRG